MTIDPETGALRWGDGAELGPAMACDEWRVTRAARQAEPWISEGTWCSYRLPEVVDAEGPWTVIAWFHEQRLWQVTLMSTRAEFGAGWGDWSRNRELARRDFHDAWLREVLGPRRSFAWGTVNSLFDMKSASSSITLHFPGDGPRLNAP